MKILVLSLAGIGDTILATPLITELRANFPEARIDAAVLWAGSRDILEGNPHLNAIHQRNLMKESRIGSVKFLNTLRRQRYDISINTHPQSRIHYRLIARIIGAPLRLSHTYECSGAVDRWLVNRTIAQDYTRHTVENNFALLSLIGAGIRLPAHELQIFLSDAEHQWADHYIAGHKLSSRTLLGVHIGSGATKNLSLKRWPLDRYIELFRKLQSHDSTPALLLFGGPEEKADMAKVQASVGSDFARTPETSNLRQAAALIARCHAFLSVDTALMHIATAVKVPRQIIIEAPTFNCTNEPYRHPYRLVKNPAVAGRNLDYYRYDGAGIKGTREELLRCMASISVDSVYKTVADSLNL